MSGMILNRASGRGEKVLASFLVLLLASGCSYVKQDDFNRELDDIRAEMRTEMESGDREVEERLGQRIDGVDARMGELETALMNLQEEFHVTVERLENAIRFNAPVHFAYDDSTLRSQDRPLLDRFAETIHAYYPEATITVEGFTDSAGSPSYNLRLGQSRAESVREYLVDRGLPGDRLKAVSYGEASERQVIPGAAGPGEEGWQNRRVAMVIDFNVTDGPRRVAGGEGETDEDG